MSLMPRSRWLRLVLAVLALLATHVRTARAALGDAACARDGAAVVAADVAAGAGAEWSSRPAHVAAPTGAPPSPALASSCAPVVAVSSSAVLAPTPRTVWRARTSPSGPTVRPVSHAPPPPFHPPRAI